MQIKTSELTGTALSYATALAEGYGPNIAGHLSFEGWATAHGWDPVHNWEDAGPLIEREQVTLVKTALIGAPWEAAVYDDYGGLFNEGGPTPLIAVCRCLVASKLGDSIEIPPELLPEGLPA